MGSINDQKMLKIVTRTLTQFDDSNKATSRESPTKDPSTLTSEWHTAIAVTKGES